MREIKFRAWGKNSNEFLHDKDGSGLTLKEIHNIHDLDAWEFQQYTGLFDKNGREIYEGDILLDNGRLRKVVWKQNLCAFVSAAIDERGATTDFDDGRGEIIGNIYENPDLLTTK